MKIGRIIILFLPLNKANLERLPLVFYLENRIKDVYIDSIRLHGTALNTIKAVAYN